MEKNYTVGIIALFGIGALSAAAYYWGLLPVLPNRKSKRKKLKGAKPKKQIGNGKTRSGVKRTKASDNHTSDSQEDSEVSSTRKKSKASDKTSQKTSDSQQDSKAPRKQSKVSDNPPQNTSTSQQESAPKPSKVSDNPSQKTSSQSAPKKRTYTGWKGTVEKALMATEEVKTLNARLLQLDKILEHALQKKTGIKGSVGEILKSKGKSLFSEPLLTKIWTAHGHRNTLAHEMNAHIPERDLSESCRILTRAIKTLIE